MRVVMSTLQMRRVIPPLHEAVEQGNDSAAHLLLRLGASVNAKNNNGYTPCDLAVFLDNDIASHLCGDQDDT